MPPARPLRLRLHAALPAALLLASLAGCGSSRPAMVRVPLVYRSPGASEKAKSVAIAAGTRLYIEPIADERTDPTLIGKNVEESTATPVYGIEGTPPGYLDSALHTELGRMGFSLVDKPEGATHVLSTKLVRFFVTEGNTYVGEISAKVELKDKAGKIAYSGQVTGNKTQWGKSASAENYQEVFAKASADLVANLVDTPGFKKAVEGP